MTLIAVIGTLDEGEKGERILACEHALGQPSREKQLIPLAFILNTAT